MNTAIVGATGHIAQNLIVGLRRRGGMRLSLLARNTDAVHGFLRRHGGAAGTGGGRQPEVRPIGELEAGNYDVLINCTGIGHPGRLSASGGEVFRVTERFDNRILDYLQRRPEALYINFSSGAAYGSDWSSPARPGKAAAIAVDPIRPSDYYTIAKLNAEAKHRAHPGLNIADIRVFGFFSRFIDLSAPYLLAELANCVLNGAPFRTDDADLTRDFIHPRDLVRLVERCIEARTVNRAFDARSAAPVTKRAILDYFVRVHRLEVLRAPIEEAGGSPTGAKAEYYSLNGNAEEIGYRPRYTSLEAIACEMEAMKKRQSRTNE